MSILHEAHDLINGQRAKDYGSPDINFAHIAAIWSGVLTPIISRNITSVEVALCMQGVKMARLAKSPDHRDSAVDNCGYAGIIEKLVSSHTEAQCNLDVVPQ